jgi:CrcB protein
MRQHIRIYAAVATGSAIGSAARYGTSLASLQLLGSSFPWGTLIVNAVGSFLIGFYFTLTEPDGRLLAGPATRQFVLAGFCGGFTTFSVFSLETVLLARNGSWFDSGAYVLASVLVWLTAVWLGHGFGLRINRLRWRSP